MIIKTDGFVTEVSGIASLDELTEAELGDPCLLIVHADSSISAGSSAKTPEFFANAPFVTALADNEPGSSISGLFDMVIPAGDTGEFTAKLFKDKTKFQAEQINSCFIAARRGSQEDILDCESKAFYRLLADKTGGGSDE